MRGLNLGLGLSKPVTSGGGSSYLDGVLASAIFDIDATISDSYGGSGQTVSNLIASPSTGESQTDFDFWLGASSSAEASDPTFATDKFTVDGGDYLTCKTLANYLAQCGRTDVSKPVTFVMAMQTANTTFHYYWGVGNTPAGQQGYGLRISSGNLQIFARGDSANRIDTVKASPSITAATNTLLVVSFDYGSGTGKYAINSATMSNWTPSATAYTSDADTNEFTVGASFGSSSPMPSGGIIYHMSAFNEIFDDTKLAAVKDHLETRHARSY